MNRFTNITVPEKIAYAFEEATTLNDAGFMLGVRHFSEAMAELSGVLTSIEPSQAFGREMLVVSHGIIRTHLQDGSATANFQLNSDPQTLIFILTATYSSLSDLVLDAKRREVDDLHLWSSGSRLITLPTHNLKIESKGMDYHQILISPEFEGDSVNDKLKLKMELINAKFLSRFKQLKEGIVVLKQSGRNT